MVEARLPQSIQSGHYVAWVSQYGKPVTAGPYSFHPFVVNDLDSYRPFFDYFGGILETNDVSRSYVLERGKTYPVIFGPLTEHARLKWIPVDKPDSFILTPIAIPGTYLLSGYGSPSFKLASNMRPGKYTVLVQQTASDGSVKESHPWVRVIEIR